jgi:hypothetical protein
MSLTCRRHGFTMRCDGLQGWSLCRPARCFRRRCQGAEEAGRVSVRVHACPARSMPGVGSLILRALVLSGLAQVPRRRSRRRRRPRRRRPRRWRRRPARLRRRCRESRRHVSCFCSRVYCLSELDVGCLLAQVADDCAAPKPTEPGRRGHRVSCRGPQSELSGSSPAAACLSSVNRGCRCLQGAKAEEA